MALVLRKERLVVTLFVMIVWAVLALMAWPSSADIPTASVTVNARAAIFVTNEKYLSLGMDSNLIRDRWETFSFESMRLKTLARGLSPAYLRLSGTDGDRMVFVPNGRSTVPEAKASDWPFPPTEFNMTGEDWDNINRFCRDVGWRIIFGLNGQLRQGPDWDPRNAIELLEYSISRGYFENLDFELGNEPDLWPGGKGWVAVSGTQLGKDVNTLYDLLHSRFQAYFSASSIVGPDVANAFSNAFVTEFLSSVKPGNVEAVTWHHYYGGGELKYLNNYTDPKVLNAYALPAKNVVQVVRNSVQPHLKVWQGETSSTFSPPGSDIDESYVAGYMLLDKMGLNAVLGVDLFVRQTFYGFWFALIDSKLEPRPNYWVARLFKTLVGRHVLKVGVKVGGGTSDTVRMYAHCTSSSAYYQQGAITIYGMNLMDSDVTLDLSGMSGTDFVDEYLLTPGKPGDLTSSSIALNGKVIEMTSDFELPVLTPRAVPYKSKVVLPSKAMAFYVITDARAGACM